MEQCPRASMQLSDENFIAIGSAEDERLIKDVNKKATGTKKDDSIKKESKEEESTRKRKLGTRKKIKSRKRRFRQDTSQDDQTDSEKENDELKYLRIRRTRGIGGGSRRYQDEIPKGFDRVLWGDLMIMFNPRVHTLVTEAGLVIHMLVEKKYHLRKKVLLKMLKLRLESEEDSTMAFELLNLSRKLAIPEKMATGKGTSNPLMAGSLPKLQSQLS
ncbi:hypothetical protein Tco_1468461 [Tanacetum coccineum]